MTNSVMIGDRSASTMGGTATRRGLGAIPRCKIAIVCTADGCQIVCSCDDAAICRELQASCEMLAGGACSVCCTANGMALCQCNLACCQCVCEKTADGVCISCRCGDAACRHMVQAICECLSACRELGCLCTLYLDGTPVCCSAC